MNNDKITLIITTTLLTALLFAISIHSVSAKQVCQKTVLYSLPFHPQKHQTVLCHPVGKDLVKANNANLQFNAGVVAGQKAPADMKCPSSDKDFCDGWRFVK